MKTQHVPNRSHFTSLLFFCWLLLMPLSAVQGQVYNGNLKLETQAEVDAFSYSKVTGTLEIGDGQGPTNISNLHSLSGLTAVGGALVIANTNLPDVDPLANLVDFYGDIIVASNAQLMQLNGLAGIDSVREGPYGWAEDIAVAIFDNPLLSQIDGLAGITFTNKDGFDIRNNNALTNVDGLSGFSVIESGSFSGGSHIANNATLLNVDGLSGITRIEYLSIADNPALTDLSGLSNLQFVGKELGPGFTIRNNDALTTLNGLPGFDFKVLWITDNDLLSDLSALNAATWFNGDGRLNIENNPSFTEVCQVNDLILRTDYDGDEGRYPIIKDNGTGGNIRDLFTSGPCGGTCPTSTFDIKVEYNQPESACGAQDGIVEVSVKPVIGIIEVSIDSGQTYEVVELGLEGGIPPFVLYFTWDDFAAGTHAIIFRYPYGCPDTLVVEVGSPCITPESYRSDMLSYWSFDDETDPGKDDHGVLDGTLISTPTWSNSGQVGGALTFDGSNYVELDYADFRKSSSDEFSYSAWFKRTDNVTSGYRWLFGLGGPCGSDNGKFYYSTYIHAPSGELHFSTGPFCNSNNASPSTVISLNEWHHMTSVFKDGEVISYVDGVEIGREPYTSGTPSASNGLVAAIGNNLGNLNVRGFQGMIDEVAYFNRGLESHEVMEIYQKGVDHEPLVIPRGPEPDLLLWNKLGSQSEIENSEIGEDGTYLGGTFVNGVHGQALKLDKAQAGDVFFPKEVLLPEQGTIEFWAKLQNTSSSHMQDLGSPILLQATDGTSDYRLMFSRNDGMGQSGLIGSAGDGYYTATHDNLSANTYFLALQGDDHRDWHHYALVWDANGINVNGQPQIAVFVDGALNSSAWQTDPQAAFSPLGNGTILELLGYDNFIQGQVLYDNLKIWDGAKTEFADRFAEDDGVATAWGGPENLSVSFDTQFMVPLQWEDAATGEDSYVLERSVGGGAFAPLYYRSDPGSRVLLAAGIETYTDTLDIFGPEVRYLVRAVQGSEASAPSNVVMVQQPQVIQLLGLNAACAPDPTTELRWEVYNPNGIGIPYIWAQWWTSNRDTLVAPPGYSYFTTPTVPQDGSTYGDDNITGIWWVDNWLNSPAKLVFSPDYSACATRLAATNTAPSASAGLFTQGLKPYMKGQMKPNDFGELMQLSPNPVQTYLTIELPEMPQPMTLQVFDPAGRLLLSRAFATTGRQKLDLSELSAGLYFLRWQSGPHFYGTQIVKR